MHLDIDTFATKSKRKAKPVEKARAAEESEEESAAGVIAEDDVCATCVSKYGFGKLHKGQAHVKSSEPSYKKKQEDYQARKLKYQSSRTTKEIGATSVAGTAVSSAVADQTTEAILKGIRDIMKEFVPEKARGSSSKSNHSGKKNSGNKYHDGSDSDESN
jgi:hypothetical protein